MNRVSCTGCGRGAVARRHARGRQADRLCAWYDRDGGVRRGTMQEAQLFYAPTHRWSTGAGWLQLDSEDGAPGSARSPTAA